MVVVMPPFLDAVRSRWRTSIAPTPIWRAAARFTADGGTDRAASLSYYGTLSLFPAAFVAITLLGLLGQDRVVADIVHFAQQRGADTATAQVVETIVRGATQTSSGALSVALVVSLILGLNAASGLWSAAGRAMNAVHGLPDERSLLRRRLTTYILTIVTVVLVLVTIVMVFLGGDWAGELFRWVGLGTTFQDAWAIARWPLALLSALAALTLTRRHAPAPGARQEERVTLGSLVTVGLWLALTFGFAVYVSGFSHYGALYGVFSAIILLLIWLYLLSLAFLFGVELDLQRGRRAAAGGPTSPPPDA
ncbi:unannotated protein [freshwater metagenome]|uniref:Unannotated protein n=1 Tax=freshwater metagenome TaxID=449393 RepID=A0A6J7J1T3_9ZZZZ|nr:YihY family inner membrane protein [Actinomycetota bacterium]